MDLQIIDKKLSVCKIKSWEDVKHQDEFVFLAKTDHELSLVCDTEDVPKDCIIVEHGWRCFRIAENAAFEKYGMIAGIANIVANEKTGIFVVATYDTDYILIKENKFTDVINVLKKEGYQFI
jgi:hypothetical protein